MLNYLLPNSMFDRSNSMEIQKLIESVSTTYNLGVLDCPARLPSYSNISYSVRASNGRMYVVKLYLNLSQKEVTQIHQLEKLLREKDMFVPEVLNTVLGSTTFSWDEKTGEVVEYIWRGNDSVQDIAVAGTVLAKIHRVGVPKLALPMQNLVGVNKKILDRIQSFRESLQSGAFPVETAGKIELIGQFLDKNAKRIQSIIQDFSNYRFPGSLVGLIHGDYSWNNMIEDVEGKVHVIDWERTAVGSQVFELQRTVGMLCGYQAHNGYLAACDFKQVKVLLASYLESHPGFSKHLYELVDVAEYLSLVYWLGFVLEKILQSDYRILSILPDSVEEMMFWSIHLDEYREQLREISS